MTDERVWLLAGAWGCLLGAAVFGANLWREGPHFLRDLRRWWR